MIMQCYYQILYEQFNQLAISNIVSIDNKLYSQEVLDDLPSKRW